MGHYFFDQYSLLHFAVGIVTYFWGFSLIFGTLIHTVFEIAENTQMGVKFINQNLADIWPGGKPRADTNLNILGDTLFFVVGWIVAFNIDLFGKKNNWY